MASFDIIEAAGNGYRIAWTERAYLARMAWMPILLRLAAYVLIIYFGYETNLVRQALLLLPAFFIEGWVLAHMTRLTLLGERGPFRPSGEEMDAQIQADERARGIMAAALVYTLTKFLSTGVLAVFYGGGPGDVPETAAPAPPPEATAIQLTALAMVGILAMAWSFRFFWLHIPAAINISMYRFLRLLRGFSTSFYLVGTWLLCFVPIVLIMISLTGLLLLPYDPAEKLPSHVNFMVIGIRAVLETVIALVSTAAIAYAFRKIADGWTKSGKA